MASVEIRAGKDVAKSRHIMRTVLLAQKCNPTVVARSAAVMSILTESVVQHNVTLRIDFTVIWNFDKRIVELDCDMPLNNTTAINVAEIEKLLMKTVNDIQIRYPTNHLKIILRLW